MHDWCTKQTHRRRHCFDSTRVVRRIATIVQSQHCDACHFASTAFQATMRGECIDRSRMRPPVVLVPSIVVLCIMIEFVLAIENLSSIRMVHFETAKKYNTNKITWCRQKLKITNSKSISTSLLSTIVELFVEQYFKADAETRIV